VLPRTSVGRGFSWRCAGPGLCCAEGGVCAVVLRCEVFCTVTMLFYTQRGEEWQAVGWKSRERDWKSRGLHRRAMPAAAAVRGSDPLQSGSSRAPTS